MVIRKTTPRQKPKAPDLLAEILAVITQATPGLRRAGVVRLAVDGVHVEIDPTPVEAAPRRAGEEDLDGSFLDHSRPFRRKPSEDDIDRNEPEV